MYQIGSAAALAEFRDKVNRGETDANTSAELTADIVLNEKIEVDENGTVTNAKELSEWTPIGSISQQYSGTFDGNGHTISGLYIAGSDDAQGLFGYLGTNGKIEYLTVSGSVSGGMYVGGIVGWNDGGRITNCAFSGEVSGSSSVGGVVGQNFGSVENCYNTGKASDSGESSSVGGVVGQNNIGATVSNCYNTDAVSGSNYAGGVVGGNSGSVKNCYNTGNISGGISGGVVGVNASDASVTNCYFLKQDGVPANGIGYGDSTGQTATEITDLTDQDKFLGWDFTDIWRISKSLNRPVLQDNAQDGLPPGLGTANSPYEISTATQLKNFATAVNSGSEKSAHAVLMNNIDLNPGMTIEDDGTVSGNREEWTPIGNEDHPYTGTFNGNGHKIENLYINNINTSATYQGLFGRVSGTVQNLTVTGTVNGGSVNGGTYVGGVVGYNNGGTVTGCTFSGSGSVSGVLSVGGVVGVNGGTVENCYNTGTVSGSASVGGVVGVNGEDDSASGSVVGQNGEDGSASGSVTNCYNTGSVSGNGDYAGGVVGFNNSGTVTNCYFLQTDDVNKNLQGIGVGSGDANGKNDTAFHSGEVAWLLENGQAEDQTTPVWGQNDLKTDKSWPTLVALDKNAKPVYKVAFISDNTEIDAKYANNGMTVDLPATNPTKEGHTFSHWRDKDGTQVTEPISVNSDTTYYAKWTPVAEPEPDPEPTPEPEPEEPPYSGKYSYEISTDIGDNGTLSVDRYATEGDTVTIEIAPDQAYKLDDLTVTAGVKDVELTDNGDGTFSFTMPSADVKITASFAEDPDWTPDEPEEPATDVSDIFTDVAPDAWYKAAVQYAYDNGLMTGVSVTEFAPEQTTTRAMIVSILARLEGVTTAEAAGFADVNDEWYATAVNWAANVGVVNGYEDNTFRPNTAITREQLAAILMNYAAYKGEDVSARAALDNYTDQPSTWAEEAMQWAVAEGLISGVTNDQLQPQSSATRAQVAAILQRFLDK